MTPSDQLRADRAAAGPETYVTTTAATVAGVCQQLPGDEVARGLLGLAREVQPAARAARVMMVPAAHVDHVLDQLGGPPPVPAA